MYDELFDISNLSSENIESCIRIFIKNSIQKSLLESDSNSVLSFSHQFNDFNWVQASRLGVAHRENKFLSLTDKDFIDFKSVISEIGDTTIFDEFEDSCIVLVDIDFELSELVSYKDINLFIVSRATVFKVLYKTLPMGNKKPTMHSNKLN
jgi:hypothetical protein